MSAKTDVQVVIGGKVFNLSGYESEEYLQKVASYLNGKLAECNSSTGFTRLPYDRQSVLLQLNIADDYFKAKTKADSMVSEDTNKEQQLYDLRHEVIEAQIKQESAARMIEEYKEQINALQRKIIQLEAEKGRNDI